MVIVGEDERCNGVLKCPRVMVGCYQWKCIIGVVRHKGFSKWRSGRGGSKTKNIVWSYKAAERAQYSAALGFEVFGG